ncbi:hypothetical protein V6N13_133287 [Hibiscus sabdariffa]
MKTGRFLSAAGGGESLLGSIKIAVLPIAKVFTICFMGFLMASKYVNILPANGRKLLNGVVHTCECCSQRCRWLGHSFFFVVTLVKPPYPYFKFSIVQIAIGNIGNVPLVPIAALCRDTSNPFGDTNTCSTRGTAYISFGQWVGAIILYTYVFHMFAPPVEGTFDLEEASLPHKFPQKDASSEHAPLPVEEVAPIDSDYSNDKGKIKDFLVFLHEKLKLKQILQPPIIASILAMVLGAVPFLKRLIFTSDAPLYFFTDSCIILGEAMIPCILLALGGNLVDGPGPGSSRIGLRTLVAIIVARLCLVPPAGLGIVMLADKLGFLTAGDMMFRFVLLLQHSMPTSVLSGEGGNSLRDCREGLAVAMKTDCMFVAVYYVVKAGNIAYSKLSVVAYVPADKTSFPPLLHLVPTEVCDSLPDLFNWCFESITYGRPGGWPKLIWPR